MKLIVVGLLMQLVVILMLLLLVGLVVVVDGIDVVYLKGAMVLMF